MKSIENCSQSAGGGLLSINFLKPPPTTKRLVANEGKLKAVPMLEFDDGTVAKGFPVASLYCRVSQTIRLRAAQSLSSTLLESLSYLSLENNIKLNAKVQ